MEELYIAILKRIENEMPEIAYIDEDYGQLEGMNSENEDFYPVTFPCVLVGNTEADWKDIGLGTQAGEITLTVRLGIDCYHDTHIGSGTTGRIKERMEMAGKGEKRSGAQRLRRSDRRYRGTLADRSGAHGRTGQSQKPGLYPARKHQGV